MKKNMGKICANMGKYMQHTFPSHPTLPKRPSRRLHQMHVPGRWLVVRRGSSQSPTLLRLALQDFSSDSDSTSSVAGASGHPKEIGDFSEFLGTLRTGGACSAGIRMSHSSSPTLVGAGLSFNVKCESVI